MKTYFAAAALSLLASAALAAPPDQAAAPEDGGPAHHRFSSEDMAAMAEARIAGLKAGLKLTPEQEKNWPQLETILHDVSKARAAQIAARRERMKAGERDALEGLREHASMLTTRAAELNKIADAAKPLYDSLDDAQKRRFGVLMRQASGMYMLWRGGHR